MKFMDETETKQVMDQKELQPETMDGKEAVVEGCVHRIRDLGEITFVILRNRQGLFQMVLEKDGRREEAQIREGQAIRAAGVLRKEPRAPFGMELAAERITVLSGPSGPLPAAVGKGKLSMSLDAKLNMRSLTLRNPKERAVFRIQEGICRGFRRYLTEQGFTEIHTPKIAAKSAEGGSGLFRLSYFHRPAVLVQSPQLYKQMMVGVFDRVFETGPVFRAEKHNTKRHLNEYTSLDLEMGFIDSFEDICRMEAGMIRSMMDLLKEEYRQELELLQVRMPDVSRFPCVRFDEAKKLVAEHYGRRIRSPHDLEPEEESLIGAYFKEMYQSDFVFVTHYPSKKRPFYAMEDPSDPSVTLSFDLLFRGVEVTTGGQRIHEPEKLEKKLLSRGMEKEGMEEYLECFRYGMPPHGGLGIGLERFTMQLLELENIRETSLFPRDMSRLKP